MRPQAAAAWLKLSVTVFAATRNAWNLSHWLTYPEQRRPLKTSEVDPKGEPQKLPTRGRVLIVDGDRASARVLASLLVELGLTVSSLAHEADGALRLAQQCEPDLVLMSLQLEGDVDGADAAQRLQRELALRVIYLTEVCDLAILERANEALPYAYLLKPVRPDDLRCCVELALYKRRLALPYGDRDAASRSEAVTQRLRELSTRELQVLRLIGLGHTSKDIAQRLAIAKSTVDTYRQRLAEKLGIKDRTELMVLAASLGAARRGSSAGIAR